MKPITSVKLFNRAVINHRGIPFERKIKQPNSVTAVAMLGLQQGKGITADSFNASNTGLVELAVFCEREKGESFTKSGRFDLLAAYAR
ncbi:MAG: type II toxin-antitoxin system RelB/DinJ family antitoxin [Pontibacterium sp.]